MSISPTSKETQLRCSAVFELTELKDLLSKPCQYEKMMQLESPVLQNCSWTTFRDQYYTGHWTRPDNSGKSLVVSVSEWPAYDIPSTIIYTLKTLSMEIIARHESFGFHQLHFSPFRTPIALLRRNARISADGAALLEIEVRMGAVPQQPRVDLSALLLHGSLEGSFKPRDTVFILFKKIPNHHPDQSSIGRVYASGEILKSVCDYFAARKCQNHTVRITPSRVTTPCSRRRIPRRRVAGQNRRDASF